MEGEFNMVDFQMDNNLFGAMANQPSTMFTSVARDFSEFGHNPMDADLVYALNRKGGNLVEPNIEDEHARAGVRKKRGRKNRYYRIIDVEDEKEANKGSGSDID